MQRWQSLTDIFMFPLKLLFFGIVLIAISTLILNPNTSMFYVIESNFLIIFANVLKSIGNFTVVNFPLIVLIRFLSRRNGYGIDVVSGVLGYVVFLTVTMFLATRSLPSSAYSSIMGISVNTSNIPGLSGSIQTPLQTGIVGALVCGVASRMAYRTSRSKLRYGIFSFIDRDTYSLILSALYCLLLGVAFSWIWPYFIKTLVMVFDFIASDISNPVNLFVYGIFDRVLSVFNLGGLIRNTFWFTEAGGSWLDLTGVPSVGDVSVWMAQVATNIFPSGFGRFITPYYILNIFSVPAMLLALYTTFTDKIEKRRVRMFFALALVLSLLTGITLPLEMLLLISAPLLFAFHIGSTGMLFGICAAFNINLGFSHTGSTIAAMPGNIFDILIYIRNASAQHSIIGIGIIGIISAIMYFLFTKLYYNYLAIDLFNTGLTQKKIDGFVVAIGGIENIKMVNSSPLRLYVQIYDSNLIDYNHFKRLGATKILETKAGYAIDFGAGSTIYRRELNRRLKSNKRRLTK